jgi:hypothetical protein
LPTAVKPDCTATEPLAPPLAEATVTTPLLPVVDAPLCRETLPPLPVTAEPAVNDTLPPKALALAAPAVTVTSEPLEESD